MKNRHKIAIITSIIFCTWVGITAPSVCVFIDGPSPDWLGSNHGCGPLITYELQKYFGILWYH